MVATMSSTGTVKSRAAAAQWTPYSSHIAFTVFGAPVVPIGLAPSTEIPSGVSAQVTLPSKWRCCTACLRSSSTMSPSLAAVVGAGFASGSGASAGADGVSGRVPRCATLPISSLSLSTCELSASPFSLEPWLLPQ